MGKVWQINPSNKENLDIQSPTGLGKKLDMQVACSGQNSLS